jgi:hypothetical protein
MTDSYYREQTAAAATTTTTSYTKAQAVPGEPSSTEEESLAVWLGYNRYAQPGVKQGHKFCGRFCDMRKAVIVVNSISIGLSVIGLIGLIVLSNVDPANYDDDEIRVALNGLHAGKLGAASAILLIQVMIRGMGIYGALKYNKYMVAGCLLVYIFEIFTALWFLDWLDFLIAALFAYPHIFFIIEVHEGILSESTYDVEEYSGCGI